MRCCENWRKALRAALFGALLVITAAAQASELRMRNAHLVAGDDGYSVSADFSIDFSSRLEQAVSRGVVLYFVADFELSSSRWYWFDEHVVQRSKTFQLSYHALTRQYRLSTGVLHQSYATLDDALRVIARLRNWQVIEKGEVKVDQTYQAALRMRLDLSQMAKTFQVSALANRDWNLSSEWQRWTFIPADAVLAAPAAVLLPLVPASPPVAPGTALPAGDGK